MLRIDVEQQPVAHGDRTRLRRAAVGGEAENRIRAVGVLVDQQRAGGEHARPARCREIQAAERISRDRRSACPHLAPGESAVVVGVEADRLVEIAECYVPAAVDAAVVVDAQGEIALARLMRQGRCRDPGEGQHRESCEKAPHHAVPDPLVRRHGHQPATVPPAFTRTAGSATTDAQEGKISPRARVRQRTRSGRRAIAAV